MDGRRQRRKREVRERILRAARELFTSRGIDPTSLASIRDRADVAHKTVFNHFTGKAQIVEALAQQDHEHLYEILERIRKADRPTSEKLQSIFVDVAQGALAGGPMHPELMLAAMRIDVEKRSERQAMSRIQAQIRGILEEGRARGEVGPQVDVGALTDILQGSFYGMLLTWLFFPDYPLEERARGIGRSLAASIAADPGA
jgi:AcrR family transcriptional regulator